MKKFKGLIILMAIVSPLQSCDPYSNGYICNDTTADIEMELRFNYDSLGQLSRNEFLTHYNEQQIDGNAIQIRIDTASMVGYYRLKSNTCALIGHGMSGYPPLNFYHLVIQTKNKALAFPRIDEHVKKFFKKEEGFEIGLGGDYYLKIK